MPNKTAVGLAAILTATIALLVTIGLPGPTWLAITLAVCASIELAALVATLWGNRRA